MRRKKVKKNRKVGTNIMLAFVEAANFAKRWCPYAKAYYQHKSNRPVTL